MLLSDKKLKLWSSGPRSYVFVWQDGSGTDPDATQQYDNGFVQGAQLGTLRSETLRVVLGELRNDYQTGATLTFSITGTRAWQDNSPGGMRVQPNDRVEFFAEVPTGPGTFHGDVPSWHMAHASQTGQVRWVRCWIKTVSADSEAGTISVETEDPVSHSNCIKVQRSGNADPEGEIKIPKVAFNVPQDSEDHWYAVKKTDPGTGTTPAVFGIGGPLQPTDQKMTVAEILQYMEDTYLTDLLSEGVVATTLWESSDLTPLTIKPEAIVLQDVGFGDAIRQIMKWVPDHSLVVDHKTLKWRIIPVQHGFTDDTAQSTTVAANVSGQPYAGTVTVDDVSLFSDTAGQDGNAFRIYDPLDPEKSGYHYIHSIVGSQLRTSFDFLHSYPVGSFVVPMRKELLPTGVIAADPAASINLGLDLQNAFSAVSIYSVHQKTTTSTMPYSTLPGGPTLMQPGWQQGMEAFWKEDDADRTYDYGKDGGGLIVYDITDEGGSDVLWIDYAHSQHGNDHVNGEWDGCSVWLWTVSGGNQYRNSHQTFNILAQTAVADIGNGNPGLKVKLSGGTGSFPGTGLTFGTEQTPVSGTQDRLVIATDFRFSTTQANNARWEVGRKWHFTETGIVLNQGTQPHVTSCRPVKAQWHDGSNYAQTTNFLPPNQGYPERNNNTQGPWETLATGGIGAFHVWRRNPGYTERPVVKATKRCDWTGYRAPKVVQATMERTTTTVRNARYPASGFAGGVFRYYNLQKELSISASRWEEDSQDAEYDELAFRLWRLYSWVHHRGEVTAYGQKEHGKLWDLAVRCALDTNRAPAGTGMMLESFWGAVTNVTLRFDGDQVSLGFDNTSPLQAVAHRVFEELSISQVSKTEDLAAQVRKMTELPKCLQSSFHQGNGRGTCSSHIRDQHRNSGTNGKVVVKDNAAGGGNPINLGMSDGAGGVGSASSGGGPGFGSLAHGPNASWTPIRDRFGGLFLIDPQAGMIPATQTGSWAEPNYSATTPPTFNGTPQQNEEALVHTQMGGAGGLIPQFPVNNVHTVITSTLSSGGTTTFSSQLTAFDFTPYVGGDITILDWDPENQGRTYTITAAGAGYVTVAAISHADPEDNVNAVIMAKPAPRPDPTDFPNGGFPGKDANGEWAVAVNGSLLPATLNVGTNLLELPAIADTREVQLGLDSGSYSSGPALENVVTHKAADARFDFSTARSLILNTQPNINSIYDDPAAAMGNLSLITGLGTLAWADTASTGRVAAWLSETDSGLADLAGSFIRRAPSSDSQNVIQAGNTTTVGLTMDHPTGTPADDLFRARNNAGTAFFQVGYGGGLQTRWGTGAQSFLDGSDGSMWIQGRNVAGYSLLITPPSTTNSLVALVGNDTGTPDSFMSLGLYDNVTDAVGDTWQIKLDGTNGKVNAKDVHSSFSDPNNHWQKDGDSSLNALLEEAGFIVKEHTLSWDRNAALGSWLGGSVSREATTAIFGVEATSADTTLIGQKTFRIPVWADFGEVNKVIVKVKHLPQSTPASTEVVVWEVKVKAWDDGDAIPSWTTTTLQESIPKSPAPLDKPRTATVNITTSPGTKTYYTVEVSRLGGDENDTLSSSTWVIDLDVSSPALAT